MKPLDPFRPEREPFFPVSRRGPRSSRVSVALPHALALLVLSVILGMMFT